jgi:uncharacterized membrane protein (DUF485 family)
MPVIIGEKTYKASALGSLIIFLVIVACFVFWLLGHPLTPNVTLGLIAALAVGILLL